MTDIDTFINNCRDAMTTGQDETRSVVEQALTDPERFAATIVALPKPWFFVADDDLTVFCTSAAPGSASAPHDHATWSVLGCFSGAEESWWHDTSANAISTTGTSKLVAGDVHALPVDAVHSVMNRWDTANGVVHVYKGNFLALDRHVWDPTTGIAHPAGMHQPIAPLNDPVTLPAPPESSDELMLDGTMFAALSVNDVTRIGDWLHTTLGLAALTDQDDTCSTGERFAYYKDPTSPTVVGIHRQPNGSPAGLDHLALRVGSLAALERWHSRLDHAGAEPTAITDWQHGTFVEIVGPENIRIRLFVPKLS